MRHERPQLKRSVRQPTITGKHLKAANPFQRVTVNESPKGLEIVISARRSVLITLVYGLLIAIWGIVEYILIHSYFSYWHGENISDSKTALLSFLVAFTLFGAFGIYAWFYNVVGKERILIRYRTLSMKQEVWGFGITWKYDLSQVSNLRISIKERFFQIFSYSIAFDYKNDIYHFASFVTEPEAQIIIDELQKHLVTTGSV